MDTDTALAELRSLYPGRVVLHIPEVATVLGRTPGAIEAAKHRKTLGLTFKNIAGRQCVALTDLATLLADAPKASPSASKGRRAGVGATPRQKDAQKPPTKPRRYESMVADILMLNRQTQAEDELVAALLQELFDLASGESIEEAASLAHTVATSSDTVAQQAAQDWLASFLP